MASRVNMQMSRVSYHIVLNMSTDLATNKYIAEVAGLNYQSKHKTDSPFDLAIYGYNKSLRLPMCGKIKNNVFDARAVLNIEGEFQIVDFIVSDVSKAVRHIPSNILFDKRFPI